ncbi:hypothetical protein VDGL01_12180 [Verticillium dahliae]
MVDATTHDLSLHLEEINMKLQSLTPPAGPMPTEREREWFERERTSTEKCLDICAQGLALLDEMSHNSLSKVEPPNKGTQTRQLSRELSLAEIMTLFALRKCSDDLRLHLRTKIEQAERSMQVPPCSVNTTQNNARRLAAQSESVEQCLAVLQRASEQATSSRVHVVEDVDIGVEGEQMLITSRDQLFEVRRVSLGDGARQVVMSSTPATVREFLQRQKPR